MTARAPLTRRLTNEGVTDRIIKAFYRVYDGLGYGFLEKVYGNALALELTEQGLSVAREVPIDVFYRGNKIGHYRADFIVEQCVIVESKASRSLIEDDRRQLLNCLRATKLETGLLLHFGPKPSFRRLFVENPTKTSLSAPTSRPSGS